MELFVHRSYQRGQTYLVTMFGPNGMIGERWWTPREILAIVHLLRPNTIGFEGGERPSRYYRVRARD